MEDLIKKLTHKIAKLEIAKEKEEEVILKRRKRSFNN
jgi:hypothetical protein